MDINTGPKGLRKAVLSAAIVALLAAISAQSQALAQQAQPPYDRGQTPSAGAFPNAPQTAQASVGSGMDVAQPRGANIAPGQGYNGNSNSPGQGNNVNANGPGQGYNANPNGPGQLESAMGAGTITVTTTSGIDGYRVRRYLGVVRGVRVFQPTIGESFKASFKGIIGGNIGSYVEMCEKARQQAYEQMIGRATALGANAILGFRFDSSAFSINSSEMGTEVLCYGTAVYEEAER